MRAIVRAYLFWKLPKVQTEENVFTQLKAINFLLIMPSMEWLCRLSIFCPLIPISCDRPI